VYGCQMRFQKPSIALARREFAERLVKHGVDRFPSGGGLGAQRIHDHSLLLSHSAAAFLTHLPDAFRPDRRLGTQSG